MSPPRFFATASDWVAASSRGSFEVALDYARQRAKLYGRAEVWSFRSVCLGGCATPQSCPVYGCLNGRAEVVKVLTVYAPPLPAPVRSLFVRMSETPRGRSCGCVGEHVPACRAWGAL